MHVSHCTIFCLGDMEKGLLTETIPAGIKFNVHRVLLQLYYVKNLDLYFRRRECCAIVYMLQCIMLLLKWVLQKAIRDVIYQVKRASSKCNICFLCLPSKFPFDINALATIKQTSNKMTATVLEFNFVYAQALALGIAFRYCFCHWLHWIINFDIYVTNICFSMKGKIKKKESITLA